LSQADKSKSATSRRVKKAPAAAPAPATPATVPVPPKAEARSVADKSGAALHAEFQALSKRAAELELQVGELVDQLKKAREELGKSKDQASELDSRCRDLLAKSSRVFPLEQEIAAIRPQLEEARRRLKESQGDLKKTREERDRSSADLGKAEARAQELSTQASRVAALEQELSELKSRVEESGRQLEGTQADLKTAREALERAEAESAELRSQATDRASQADQAQAAAKSLEESLQQIKKLEEARAKADAENAELRTQAAELKQEIGRSEARTAEATRYFESLERELIDSREAEAKIREEAAKASSGGEEEQRLRAEVARLESAGREQEETVNRLVQKVVDLEDRLAEAQGKPPEETEPPLTPIAITVDPEPPRPPTPAAPIASAIPPPQAVPGPTSTAETTLRPQNLFGPNAEDGQPAYLLHEILSKDALGVVYRCSERTTGRKFLALFMAGQAGEEQTQAIERGVEKLVALPHPNILHVQGVGRRKNRLYLMMDHVEAPTLGQAKIQEVPRICAIVRDAASAVHYAHEEGIFHGDLNPESILVSQQEGQDHALVTGFGLGFLQEIMHPVSAGKEAPPVVRNPAYLPPEQVRVMKAPLAAAGDVYSLGATLYSVLAGRPPFEGKDAAQVSKRVMIEEPLPIEKVRSGVPEAVGAVVRRAMAKERGVRFATAQEMADALTRFLDSSR